MEAINREIATSKNLKAGEPEVEAEVAVVVIEEEEAATEVADKIMTTMEALLGAEVPELATEVEAATVDKVEATKKVVASDQRLLAHQVVVHQWSRRVEALAPWSMSLT